MKIAVLDLVRIEHVDLDIHGFGWGAARQVGEDRCFGEQGGDDHYRNSISVWKIILRSFGQLGKESLVVAECRYYP